MKSKINLAAKSLLFLIVIFSFNKTTNLPIGSALPLPQHKLLDISGKMVTLKGASKANGLLVMFSCNTCPFVMRNQQRTRNICNFALKNNIGVILLNANEGEREEGDGFREMKKYAAAQAYTWQYAVDKNSELADAMGAKRTPECFLFNSALKLAYHGAIDDNPGDEKNVDSHYLQQAIDGLLSHTDIAVKESRSVGCAIKRRQ